MLIYIRGAGDIASGIAIRLRRSGFCVVMTDVARPTAIRRTVSFSGAIIGGSQRVEDVTARLAHTPEEALGIARGGDIAVMVDENCAHLAAIRPDAVVDATGADVKRPALEGIDLPLVISAEEALTPGRELGQYVVVVACGYQCNWTCRKVSHPIPDDVVGMSTSESYACSAGHAAADVAEELAGRGKRVSIITERDSFVPGMGFTNRGNMFKRFFPKNITVSNNVKVRRIVPNGLICEKESIPFFLAADTVVMSVGMTGRSEVYDQLKDTGIPCYRVGDCAQTGNALKAFHQGYEVAEKI